MTAGGVLLHRSVAVGRNEVVGQLSGGRTPVIIVDARDSAPFGLADTVVVENGVRNFDIIPVSSI